MKKHLLTALTHASVGALAIALAAPAMAQNSKPAQPAAVAPSTDPDADAAAAQDVREIVVTGSQIRGVTPAGATILTTTSAQAEEQGATNANEILSQLPQAANVFQNLPSIGGGGSVGGTIAASRLSFSSITLRNLPNFNTGAGEFTLQLMDGHRIVPIGSDTLGGIGVDASTIPTSTLLRTEIMPDGGSAIYGSNAVAGVINYITKDKFDGLQMQARGGIAGSYKQYDGSITAGTSWKTGSVFGSVTYSAHDALFGRDRDWIHAVDANPNSPLYNRPLGLNCFNPNIAITSTVNGVSSRRLYPLTGPNGTIQPFTTNGGTNGNGTTANGIAGGNRCDSTDNSAIYPKSHAINGAFGLTQSINDSLTFGVKANYGYRKTTAYQALTLTATVASTNPNYRKVCNGPSPAVQTAGLLPCTAGGTNGFFLTDDLASQSVLTDYSSVLPTATNAFVTVESWQVTPSLTWNFAKDWQVRALISYGESKDAGITGGVDSIVANARILSGLINPYNLPGSGAGAFDRLITYDYRAGFFHLLDNRVIADGPVPYIHLPGGDIHVAIGAEYTRTNARNLITGPTLSPTPSNFVFGTDLSYLQTVKSAFGEIQIPLVSEEMGIPLISSLNVSGSARYDYYNDVKGTFNKMAGVTWAPVPWIKLRGNYNTSFAAPNNLSEIAIATGAVLGNVTQNTTGPLPYFVGFIAPGNASGPNAGGLAGTCAPAACNALINPGGGVGSFIGVAATPSNGTAKGIGPQTSRTWSVGAEFSPPFIPGLTFGASYYNLKISNTIASPLQPNVQSVFDFHPELIYCHGGVTGASANAKTACAQPLSLAELTSLGFLVAADPTNPNSTGLSTLASLTSSAGPGGAFGTVPWPTIIAQYCGPAGAPGPAGTFGSCTPVAGAATNTTYSVFYVADNRSRNLGFVFSKGIDFRAGYRTGVPWGSVDLGVTGTVNISTLSQPGKGLPKVDNQLSGFSKWRMTSNLGTSAGGFRAQVTWQHSDGFDIATAQIGTIGTATVPGTINYGQTHVKSYDTLDLFLKYNFDKTADDGSVFKGMAVTLNVNNFLNLTPPRQGGGYANGTTLGRLWQLGITKDF